MLKLFKKIKDFFDQPDQIDLIEQRFYERIKDIKANPEKYAHIKKSANSSKIPPVSLF